MSLDKTDITPEEMAALVKRKMKEALQGEGWQEHTDLDAIEQKIIKTLENFRKLVSKQK